MIAFSFEEMESARSELTECNKQFLNEIENLTLVETTLCSLWEGSAKSAFHDRFLSDVQQLRAFFNLINRYVQALEQITSNYRKADQFVFTDFRTTASGIVEKLEAGAEFVSTKVDNAIDYGLRKIPGYDDLSEAQKIRVREAVERIAKSSPNPTAFLKELATEPIRLLHYSRNDKMPFESLPQKETDLTLVDSVVGEDGTVYYSDASDRQYYVDKNGNYWIHGVADACHQNSVKSDEHNEKYVSFGDESFEVIYNNDGEICYDPRDYGTYNYYSPDDETVGHAIFDVIPWLLWGNEDGDTTSVGERAINSIRG